MKYRYGQVADVLVKAGTTFQIISDDKQNNNNNNSLSGISASNPLDSTRGIDEESIEHTKARSRQELNIPFKAVGSTNFEYIAKQTPGLRVARAKAFPSSLPGNNTVNVIVVPFTLSRKIPSPPSQGFLRTVAEHLDKHRLITTKVTVNGPGYVGISITAVITTKTLY